MTDDTILTIECKKCKNESLFLLEDRFAVEYMTKYEIDCFSGKFLVQQCHKCKEKKDDNLATVKCGDVQVMGDIIGKIKSPEIDDYVFAMKIKELRKIIKYGNKTFKKENPEAIIEPLTEIEILAMKILQKTLLEKNRD